MNNPLHGSTSCFTMKKKKEGFHNVVRKANVAKKITAKVRKKTGLMDSDLYQGRN